eukprot:129290_1
MPVILVLRMLMLFSFAKSSMFGNLSMDLMTHSIIPHLNVRQLSLLSQCNSNFRSQALQRCCESAEQFIANTIASLSRNKTSGNLDKVGLHQMLFHSPQSDMIYYIKLFTMDQDITLTVIKNMIMDYHSKRIDDRHQWTADTITNMNRINDARLFIAKHCHHSNPLQFDLHQKLHQFLCTKSDTWTALSRLHFAVQTHLVHHRLHYHITALWNDMLIVIKKDILKIIIMSEKDAHHDVQFYYNEQWLALVSALRLYQCHQSQCMDLLQNVFKFERLAFALVGEAKERFNYTFHGYNSTLEMITHNLQQAIHIPYVAPTTTAAAHQIGMVLKELGRTCDKTITFEMYGDVVEYVFLVLREDLKLLYSLQHTQPKHLYVKCKYNLYLVKVILMDLMHQMNVLYFDTSEIAF